MIEFALAIGLLLVVEGALYALFPVQMKRMMMLALSQPADALRVGGLGAATVGVGIIWLMKTFAF